MSEARPKVVFIYCNYNGWKLLEVALNSVMEAASFTTSEIVVVDDVSTDNSVAMIKAKFPNVKLIVNPKTLWSETSFNICIRESSAEYVYFLGTDTVLYKGTLEKLIEFMEKTPQAAAVTCKVFFPDGRFQQNACREHNLLSAFLNFTFLGHIFPAWKEKVHDHFVYKGWSWDEVQEIEASGFTNLLVRRTVAEAAGSVDPGFRQYFSENDFCLRLRKNGGKIYYLPLGRVDHHLRGTVSKNIKQIARNYERDCFYYFRKNHGIFAAVILEALILISNVLVSIKHRKPLRVFSRFLVNPKQ